MKKGLALFALLAVMMGAAASMAAPKMKLHIGTTVGKPHVWAVGCDFFADRVKELTNGEVEIVVHGAGSVGNENAILNAMRMGSLDFMLISFTPLASVVPEGAVFCIPYIFTGYEHNARVMSTGSPIHELMNKYVARKKAGFEVLAIGGGGARCYLNTRGPIVNPEDMKDLKIRTVTNSMTKKIWSLVGAVPMAVSATEAYSAMQTGVCNGIEASLSMFNSARLCEIANYLSLSRHEFVVSHLSVGTLSKKKIPAKYMPAIRQAAKETCELVTKSGIENDEKLIKLMEERNGLKVNEINTEAFVKLFAPLQDDLAKNLDGTKDGLELLNAIRAMAK